MRKAAREWFEHFAYDPAGAGNTLNIGNSVRLELNVASEALEQMFVMGGRTDRQQGGWVLSQMKDNIDLCMSIKSAKIEKVRQKYDEWWLAFVDKICYGLPQGDQIGLREICKPCHRWDKVIVVPPGLVEASFEL